MNRKFEHSSVLRETGSVKKKWKDKLPVALVFPNSYSLGMSNLGFQLIYDLLNGFPDVVCERVFYNPDTVPLSVESNRLLNDFSLILFSVSFEQDFPTIVKLLDGAGLEPLAADRLNNEKIGRGNPLIIGGGVATFINPEPLAPIFDMIVIGEAEPVLPAIMARFLEGGTLPEKETVLQEMATEIPGCYVPALYHPIYHEDGTFSHFIVPDGVPSKIEKVIHTGGDLVGHSAILSPDAEFSNIFLTELGRGCSRGCRFCAAGYVYRPPRLWSAEQIVKTIDARPAGTARVGLLGMEMAQAKDLEVVSDYLLKESCALSFSSLRADVITPTILDLLRRSSLKSAAIAPDGASERLRRVISKHITEDDVLLAAAALVRVGVKNLKLYFMIGLPTETEDDLSEMVRLIKQVHGVIGEIGRERGQLSQLVLSVNSFVPKAWTPFQYFGFVPVKELKKKIKFLRHALAGIKNLKMAVDNPDKAFFQATMARGDRRVGRALILLARSQKNWRHVLKEAEVEPLFYAVRERLESESFPWEIIKHGISKAYLWREYQDALKNKPSKGCGIRGDVKCRRCGICHD